MPIVNYTLQMLRHPARGVIGLTLTPLLLLGCSAANPQNAEPSAWVRASEQSEAGVTTYSHKNITKDVKLTASDPMTDDQLIAWSAKMEKICPGLAEAKERSVLNDKMKLYNSKESDKRCSAGFYQHGGAWRGVAVVTALKADISGEDAAQQWAAKDIGDAR